MRRSLPLAVALLILAVALARPAAAADRVALVIGNAAYQAVPALSNPVNDAADIARALEALGFAVTARNDLDYDALRRALRDFGEAAAGSEVALVYYAGHGIEVDRQNYLVPVDAHLKSARDVDFEAVPLDLVVSAVGGAKGLRLVLLDACRENPFAAAMKRQSAGRSIGRGLSRVEPGVGTLVSFAAKEGTIAADGDGRNSPYAAALLHYLPEPNLEVSFLFRKVRDAVLAATNNGQEPFTYGSLPGRQFFLGAATSAAEPKPSPQPAAPAPSLELAYWNDVKDSTDPALIQSYLKRFPDGVFIDLARARLAALGKPEPAKQEPAAPGAAAAAPDGRALVTAIQRELARLACDPGPADGDWGPRTRTALERFAGLPGASLAGGQPSAATLDRLKNWQAGGCTQVARSEPAAEAPAPQAAPRPASQAFANPTIAGLPVDICLTAKQDCEGQAANAFCRQQGYASAASSRWVVYPQTRFIGSGGVCRPQGLVVCGGYAEIVCAN